MQDKNNTEQNISESVYDRLRYFIRINYTNQKGLADAMNMKPSQLSYIVNGNTKIGVEVLEKLYKAGCSTNWLLYKDGEMWANNETGLYLKSVAHSGFGKGDSVVYPVHTNFQTIPKAAATPPPEYKPETKK